MREIEGAGAPPFHPNVQRFIDEGRLWRAREYLASRIASTPFDAELCHQLGWVLLQMGDELEAGRYLFASGQRRPAHREAIGLFLNRFRRGGWPHVVSELPSSIRRVSLAELPVRLAADLAELGKPTDSSLGRPRRKARRPLEEITIPGVVVGVALAVIAVGAGYGGWRLLKWLLSPGA